ncbi:MAG TPA: MFS transporter [Candidatus Limnocylindria bacterium]|nr:MFS transporter [Candidatus Limnocylindria bacterium]
MRNFRLLARRNFGLLWVGGFISFVGDWVLYIGMPISIYRITGSALATTIMFVCGVLPSIVLGSVAGVYVDRWDRRRTVIIGNLLLAATLLPLALVRGPETIWIVYIVVLVEAGIGQFVNPAVGALLPRLVETEELVAANSLNSAANNLSRVVGPPIGGVIAAASGITGVAVVDAVTFLAAAALVGSMRGVLDTPSAAATVEEGVRRWRKVWAEWLDGLRLIWADAVVRTLFLLVALSSIGEGVFRVLFILYAVEILKGGAAELGLLMSAQGIGAILGSVTLVAISVRVSPAKLIGWTTLLFGLIDLTAFNVPRLGASFAVVVALFFVVGIPGAMSFPTMFSVIQARVPDAYRGRVLGALFTTSSLLALVGLGIAGTLTVPLGTLTILNIQGLAYTFAGVAMLLLLTRAMAATRVKEQVATAG